MHALQGGSLNSEQGEVRLSEAERRKSILEPRVELTLSSNEKTRCCPCLS